MVSVFRRREDDRGIAGAREKQQGIRRNVGMGLLTWVESGTVRWAGRGSVAGAWRVEGEGRKKRGMVSRYFYGQKGVSTLATCIADAHPITPL